MRSINTLESLRLDRLVALEIAKYQWTANKHFLMWKLHCEKSIARWTKINRLVPHATDVLYSLGIDITSLWSWGWASSDSRNTARDWLKWALYHLWSGYAWYSSYISKSSNKYASRDNRFSWIEKRNTSWPGTWLLPISKDSRMSDYHL